MKKSNLSKLSNIENICDNCKKLQLREINNINRLRCICLDDKELERNKIYISIYKENRYHVVDCNYFEEDI